MKISTIIMLTVTTCLVGFALAEESQYPSSARQKRKENFGSILGGEGGISLDGSNPNAGIFGGKKSQLAINPYLWQATLDTLSFMPLASADSAGGVIVTDWYENPSYPGERYKVTVLISSAELKVESLKVTSFKQILKNGVWREVSVNPKVVADLEEKILATAREIKVKKGS